MRRRLADNAHLPANLYRRGDVFRYRGTDGWLTLSMSEADAIAEAERMNQGDAPASAVARGWIYLIEGGRALKIGFSSDDPDRRLAQLQTGNPTPLRLIAKFYALRSAERALHERFAKWRLTGEWFKDRVSIRRKFERPGRLALPEPRQFIQWS